MHHEIRGPDPDGDWFVVKMDGETEEALPEAYESADKAQEAADRLNSGEGA